MQIISHDQFDHAPHLEYSTKNFVVKVSVMESGPLATTMDMLATLWKHPASSPVTTEAYQPTASVRSISPPHVWG